jgi:NTE family protein
MSDSEPKRVAIVLSGGGARGAYEAGVLSYLFEHIYPALPPGFEFDILSGTSVGAIHAAYVAASAHMKGEQRSKRILDTWRHMAMADVLNLSAGDLIGIPLRALGITQVSRRLRTGAEVVGGLVDLTPLERMVAERVPWSHLRENLAKRRPGALCISCTEIRTGRVTIFMDGTLADPRPWSSDPIAQALPTEITDRHVRASAAIPFLFPAVRIDERYYVDGGLRMNTPLSPALRLGAHAVLVVGLKHITGTTEKARAYPEEVITQPVFLLGKVLDALLLDQLEYEMRRVGLVNAWIEHGTKVFGNDFLGKINVAVREQRGVGYRHVATQMIRPSEDLGRVAAECYRRRGSTRALGVLPALLARVALGGTPPDEADLLSYLYFDRCFTTPLLEMGREDARRQHDDIVRLLSATAANSGC